MAICYTHDSWTIVSEVYDTLDIYYEEAFYIDASYETRFNYIHDAESMTSMTLYLKTFAKENHVPMTIITQYGSLVTYGKIGEPLYLFT